MDLLTALVGLFVLLATLYYFLRDQRPPNFPPGPRGVPIFGNAFQLGPQGYKPALEMAKKYGNILGFKVGSYRMVYLNDVDDIREALSKPEFASRHGYNTLLDKNSEDVNAGIILAYGNHWVDHRRFTLRTLRDFGFGKRSLEVIIQEEVDGLMEEFRKVEGQAISTQTTFNIAAFNVIWSVVAGQRFSLGDPRLLELIQLLNDFFQTCFEGVRFFSFIFPTIVNIQNNYAFLFSKKNAIFRAKLFDFFRKTIHEHRSTSEAGAEPRDFIDAYMLESKKNQENPAEAVNFKHDEDDFKLIVTLMDLFIAGGETTSTTMTWAFFLLAMHPQVQEKLHKEIIEQAADRSVALSDRPSLVYCEAVMAEIFRVSTLTPIAIPHATAEDTTFKGYNIPKNTLVFPNIYGVHHNKKTWGDPEVFRPERFITTEEGGALKFNRNSNLMPFSVGKRVCLGESLARDEFFLFLTNSVRNFHIAMPADEPPHTFEGRFGLVVSPEAHRIILKGR